jgi:hypothetical protein
MTDLSQPPAPLERLRPVTFTCRDCGQTVTEERAPGPTPRYCASCSADPVRIRERARARKVAQRRRQQGDVLTPDDAPAEELQPTTTSDGTELAGSVTSRAPLIGAETEHAATEPGHEELVVKVLVPGQRRMASITAAELQSPPAPSALDRMPPDVERPAGAVPADPPAAKPPSQSAPSARPRPKPLVVHFRNGHTHWLADNATTFCGRRVSPTATVTQRGWASCSVCEQRRTRVSSSGAAQAKQTARLLTTSDAATRLRVTPERLTALARDGVLGHKVGRSWVFSTKELDAYKRRQRAAPRRQTPRGTTSRPRSRVSRGDLQAAGLLDRLLAEERALEQRYALPFRAPAHVATTIHTCTRCGQPLLFLIFGDNARDEAGLLAYARLMEEPIHEQRLRTYVIGPPDGPAMADDASSLLLEVWPAVGSVATITPREWDDLMAALSAAH